MTTKNPNDLNDQEIDLSIVSKKIGSFFDGIASSIFNMMQFFMKNYIIVIILFVLGLIAGAFLDKEKPYDNQIIVSPNFGSTDYLYSKIEFLSSKIKQNDTVFLKSIGFVDTKKLIFVDIKPIVDVYKFVNNSDKNFELLKLLGEDGSLKKIVEESTTSKNYPFHLISFWTSRLLDPKKTVVPLLAYLNNDKYYRKLQGEYVKNVYIKMKANDTIIAQIDAVLGSFSKKAMRNSRNDKLVYYNENTQLNDIIKTKDLLVTEQGNHRIELIALDKIVKDNSVVTNIQITKGTNGKMKLILPFFFIFLFIIFRFMKAFYKKQSKKSQKKLA